MKDSTGREKEVRRMLEWTERRLRKGRGREEGWDGRRLEARRNKKRMLR